MARSEPPDDRESIARENGELAPTNGGELPVYPGEPIPRDSVEPTELQRLILVRETQLADYVVRTERLLAIETDLRTALDTERQARVTAESQIPILREQIDTGSEEIELLRRRQTELESQLGQVRAEYDTRLGEVVRQAVEAEQARHAEEVKALDASKQQLEETVASLEAQVGAAAETRSAPPATLADSFVETLQQVATREVTDQPFNVSLSRLEVEARGILRAPTDDHPAEFVTPPPGQVNPQELSTMRMEFRLSPKPPGGLES
jgi:hypothetical protein